MTEASPTRPRRVGARLAVMSWAHLLNDGASNYLPGILPAVLVTLGQPVQMAGVLVTALLIGQALQPFAGRLSDWLGGRSLVPLGLLMTSVGGGLLGLTHSTVLLIVFLVMIGVGNALFHPQALAGIRSMLSGRQGFVTSVFLVGGEVGRGLWPTAASLIVVAFGLPGLWIVAIPGIITAWFVWRAVPVLPRKRGGGKAIRWREHARPLGLLVGYQCIRTLSIYSFVTFIPIVWHERGATLVAGASIITTMTVVGVIGNLAGGYLSDRVGRRPIMLTASIAAGLLIVPTIYLNGPAEWIVAGLLGIAFFLTGPISVLVGQDIFPENRSMGSGIALGFANGMGALFVFVLGLFVGDSVVGVFWALAVLSLGSALLVLGFDRELVGRTPADP